MSWLLDLVNGKIIPFDKMLHFFIASFICMVLASLDIHWLLNLLVIALIAVLKESFDKYIKKSKFDKIDALATLIGGLTSIIVIEVVLPLFKS